MSKRKTCGKFSQSQKIQTSKSGWKDIQEKVVKQMLFK